MNKINLVILFALVIIPAVSAVTTVTTNTNLNVTSTNNCYISIRTDSSYWVHEAGNNSNAFTEMVTLSRNDTDFNSLVSGISDLWKTCNLSFGVAERYGKCVEANEEWSQLVARCDSNEMYKENYTDCKDKLGIKTNDLISTSNSLSTCQIDKGKCDIDLKNLQSQDYLKFVFGGIGIAIGAGGLMLWQRKKMNKQNPQQQNYQGR